jgi:hypothetical protein
MPGDDFAFDAYDRLIGRNSMASSPASLVVRSARPDRLDEIVERCLTLRTGRRSPDEILLLVEREPIRRPPAIIGAVSIRTVVLPSIATKDGFAWALAGARWPLVVFVGAEATLPRSAFSEMLESLEHADVVVGRRRSLRSTRNPISWIARRLFGVAVADPTSPFLGFRRDVVAGVPLELDEPLTAFELFAKSTFAFAIYDEVKIDDSGPPSPPLHREVLSRWRDVLRLFQRPMFWRYSAENDVVRPAPQETSPPKWIATAVAETGRRKAIHPLRRSHAATLLRRPASSAVRRA